MKIFSVIIFFKTSSENVKIRNIKNDDHKNDLYHLDKKDQALQILFYRFYDSTSRFAIFLSQRLCFSTSCGMN